MTRHNSWWALAVSACAIYLLAALYQLNQPGLNYDEVLDAVPAMQVVQGIDADSYGVLRAGGRAWPLMTMPYVGVTYTLYLTPIFAIFGVSAVTVRGAAVFLGFVSLLMGWGFLRRYLDDRAAAVATLLLAVNPLFVFWTRMGIWVQLVLVPITIGALWLLFDWYSEGRSRSLVLGFFMLGLGLATHIQFIWVWGALIAAWLVLSPWLGDSPACKWLWPLKRARPLAWALAIIALLVGMTPLIVFNLQEAGTFTYTAEILSTSESGWMTPRGLFIELPKLALGAFETLLSGDWFVSRIGGTFRNPLAVIAFAVAVVAIVALAATRRLPYSARRLAFIGVYITAVALQSAVIHSAESAHHLLVLWPMSQALVAVALFGVADWLSARAPERRAVWLSLLGLVLAALVAGEAWTTLRYHRALAQSGGEGHFSDAIYQLVADLDRPGAPRPIAMDWGFRRNMQILTENRVDPVEWFTFYTPPTPGFADYLTQLVGSAPDALYLFHPPGYDAFPGHWELFLEAAYRNGLEPVLQKTYYQRDGTPIILAYTLAPAPLLFDQPEFAHPLDARLDDGIQLLGYDLPAAAIRPGEELLLTLYWQALEPGNRDYKVFVHLFDDAGKLWSQHDSPPAYGARPTGAWQQGQYVPDRIRLPIPTDAPPGNYHLFIGMYDEETGARLPLMQDGVRLQGDTLGLADVLVE
jgi:hypothetical protein